MTTDWKVLKGFQGSLHMEVPVSLKSRFHLFNFPRSYVREDTEEKSLDDFSLWTCVKKINVLNHLLEEFIIN